MLAVILCSHQGAKFIEEQIESVLQQTRSPDIFLIYDWGSLDDTLTKVRVLAEKYSKIKYFCMSNAPGVYASFKQAINHALINFPKIEYLALCDQDDIWEKTKLEHSERYLHVAPHVSQLIFTDVSLISETGELISASRFRDSFYFKPDFDSLNDALFLTNPVVGMTMIISSDIASRFTKLPDHDQFMHDWSILLCAYLMKANIKYINKSLVKYRQHSNNILGSSSRESKVVLFFHFFNRIQKIAAQHQIFRQAFPSSNLRPFYSFHMVSSIIKASFLKIRFQLPLTFFIFYGILGRIITRSFRST